MKERHTWTVRDLADGHADGLEPLQTLDLARVGDFDELLAAMARTAFGGRQLGEAAEVLHEMTADPDCAVVMTLSGAMTVAKMNLVITEMVERGWVQAIVSTGALLTHGLVELEGMQHFKARPDLDDAALFARGYDRVYDTYELEANLNRLGDILEAEVFPALGDGPFSSRELLERLGQRLHALGRRGVVSACYRHGVPIYVPALSDSELGIDVATWFIKRGVRQGRSLDEALAALRTGFDPFLDVAHFTRLYARAPRRGIFTIGGGVPRNWAQQAGPFLDYLKGKLEEEPEVRRYRYGVRICPEPVHWGGLSGCTYSEGVSWGKFLPPSEGGRFAEVYADATIAWPILVKAVAQRYDKVGARAAAPAIDLPGCQPRA